MSENRYRVVVAEDEPLIRRNLCRKVEQVECGFEVVGSAGDGRQAYELLENTAANLLITDIRMPGMDGLALIDRASRHLPSARIIVVSGYDEFEYARRAIRCGVRDYLMKPVKTAELRNTLLRVRGELDIERHERHEAYTQLRNVRLSSEAAQQLEEFLRYHFTERIDLHKAAQALNINYANLGRLFKRYYNMSPMKYAMALRTEKAKQLLIDEPDIDIGAISRLVGYEDQGYFTRVFKSNTGLSPTKFRRSLPRPPRDRS